MAIRAFEIPEESMTALRDLAEATGLGEQEIAQLIQDALRTYEWIVGEQERGKVILSVERGISDRLEREGLINPQSDVLAPLINARYTTRSGHVYGQGRSYAV